MMKILKIIIFSCVYCITFLGNEVSAVDEYDVKKGQYPFMAFVYYPSNYTRNKGGFRNYQNAIIIKPDWLVSSSLLIGNNKEFPVKALIAKAGITVIDSNLTTNENVQEREVIQIVQPYNIDMTNWWWTDIILLKTITPFITTTTVKPATIYDKGVIDHTKKNCRILVFTNVKEGVQKKALTEIAIDLLAPENCGEYFKNEKMICGSVSKNRINGDEFCENNGGGPLICDNDLIGIQTYHTHYNCQPPYLYQLLSGWKNFITCGSEYKCQEDFCNGVCRLYSKDLTHYENRPTMTSITIANTATTNTATNKTKQKEETELVNTTKPNQTTNITALNNMTISDINNFTQTPKIKLTEVTNQSSISTNTTTEEEVYVESTTETKVTTTPSTMSTYRTPTHTSIVMTSSSLPEVSMSLEQKYNTDEFVDTTTGITKMINDSNNDAKMNLSDDIDEEPMKVDQHDQLPEYSSGNAFYIVYHLLFGPIIMKILF